MTSRIMKFVQPSPAAVKAAEQAMPGWHAVSAPPLADNLANRPGVMPGSDLEELRRKYLGTGFRSAQQQSGGVIVGAPAQPVPDELDQTELVTMERDNARGSGPRMLTVVVSGDDVVAVQG